LIKAIGESTGRSLTQIKTDLKKEGDLGLVAMARFNDLNAEERLTDLFHRIRKAVKRPYSNQSR
jgi:hypothetical protein